MADVHGEVSASHVCYYNNNINGVSVGTCPLSFHPAPCPGPDLSVLDCVSSASYHYALLV